MGIEPEYPRAGRAARARGLPRRRPGGGVAVLAVMLAAVTVFVIGASSGSTRGPAGGAPPTARPTAPPASALTLRPHLAPDGSLRRELEAVRRLAASGLPLFCGGRAKRVVALTFDDGPGPYTKLAISKLGQARARATFFLVGKELRAYPGLARLERLIAAFGDHTMTHPFLPALTPAAMVAEIADARPLIEQAADQPVALFRPPYEGRSPAIDREVRALGLLQVLWNVDSADSLGADFAGIERNVIAGLRPGAIILMHENRGQTIRALPTIFAALARDRLRAVTIPELVAQDPPSLAQLRAGGRGCSVTRRTGNGG